MPSPLLFWYPLIFFLYGSYAKEGSIRVRDEANAKGSFLRCRLSLIDSYFDFNGPKAFEEFECHRLDGNDETGEILFLTAPASFVQEHILDARHGRLVVDIHEATVKNSEIILTDETRISVDANDQSRQLQLSTKSLGTRTLFVVRVSTPDSSHPYSLSHLVNGIFKTSATSFKTQYEACSFGKLKWVSTGGVDVMLDQNGAYYTKPGQIVAAAEAKVLLKFNKTADKLADHVIFCQPPKGPGFTAVATANSWRVNIHHSLCLSLTTLIHEVGHNIGLPHSGEGLSAYGDETGYMGAGHMSETGPKRCFNGYKNYQLQWYKDRQLNLYDFTTPKKYRLATFVDYNKATTAEPVLINVADIFYVQYNRAKGMNLETKEMKDLVTFTEKGVNFSLLTAGLGVGQILTRAHSGKTLYIAVCKREDAPVGSTKADVMEIAIGYGKSWC